MTGQESIRFTVRGIPIPQGSSRAFVVNGHAVITSANRNLSTWRRLVSDVAQRYAPKTPWEGPIRLVLRFGLHKPAGVREWRGRGRKRHRVRVYATKQPDLDKAVRAVADSLSGIVYVDDRQIVQIRASKGYGVPGVRVEVGRVG